MARRRFFVDSVRHGAAEVAGEEAHHLTRVLRVEPGQKYEISDNESVYLAEVAEARKTRVVFHLLERITPERPSVRLTLAAALIKFDRFEWMVEKATELGVESIVPLETRRSERGLLEAARTRSGRWRRIARESSQQARRARLPEIAEPLRLADWRGDDFRCRFVLDEGGGEPLLAAAPALRQAEDRVCVLAGPEGGWTEEERAQLTAWTRVWLGPSILRAETAAMAALAVINAAWLAKQPV
jgi:16S rRNA (uracil1498-N3)-methyltransferase